MKRCLVMIFLALAIAPIMLFATPEDGSPLTRDKALAIREEVESQWCNVVEKLKTIEAREKAQTQAITTPPFVPFLSVTPPTPRNSFSKEPISKDFAQKIKNDLDKTYPKLQQKWQELLDIESLRLKEERTQIKASLRKSLSELACLPPETCCAKSNLINTLIELKEQRDIYKRKRQAYEKSLLAATCSVGIIRLQQTTKPLARLFQQTRNPLSTISAGLALLDASKKTIVTMTGLGLLYLGGKSAINSFSAWFHAPCKQHEKELENSFLQELAQLHQKIDEREKNLKDEVTRTAQQARENAFDALLKVDKLERSLTDYRKANDKENNHFDSRLIQVQADTAKVRRQLFEEIDRIKKKQDHALNKQLSSFKKQIEGIQDKIKNFTKGDQTVAHDEALAILSQELQKLGEDVRRLTPSQTRRSSYAPSDVESFSSRAPSPTNSVYSTNTTQSEAFSSHPRPRSATMKPTLDLSKILEEHSSSSESENHTIHISPPTPEKSPDSSLESSASLTQKPKSPRRRRSICSALIGKKEPKDTHDPRN